MTFSCTERPSALLRWLALSMQSRGQLLSRGRVSVVARSSVSVDAGCKTRSGKEKNTLIDFHHFSDSLAKAPVK